MKHIRKFNKSEEISDINEGKNSFNYQNVEGVSINGSVSFKIYLDKKLNKIVYQYPGRGFANDVEGIMSNDDIDDLINLLQKYRGGDVNESFKTKAQKLIDDTKKLKDDYPEKKYNKILELEKLIDGSDEDKKKFVKSIMRLLGMTKSDLPDDLYRYL